MKSVARLTWTEPHRETQQLPQFYEMFPAGHKEHSTALSNSSEGRSQRVLPACSFHLLSLRTDVCLPECELPSGLHHSPPSGSCWGS